MTVSKQELIRYLAGQQAMNRLHTAELRVTLPEITTEESLQLFLELQQVAQSTAGSDADRKPHLLSHVLKVRSAMQRQHHL